MIAVAAALSPARGRGAQDLWEPISGARAVQNLGQPRIQPLRFTVFRLDTAGMLDSLDRAPLEFSEAARDMPQELALPLPDGGTARFSIQESPVMHPRLADRYPDIKTCIGRGIDDPSAVARLDWTAHGFHAQVLSPRAAFYVDPYVENDIEVYASYYKRDYRAPGKTFACLVDDAHIATGDSTPIAPAVLTSGETLRTYRLACAATGEYTQFQGGTVALAMAAIVTTINRVNGIYETELAVRLELVPENDQIVFTNPSTDPYSNNNGSAMLNENRQTLNSTIGLSNFDIGHVFSTGGGGIASVAGVCTILRKAQGVTGSPSPVGDPFDVDYVAHEMGHQFGANHTFNGDSGSCADNRHLLTAYEPGSGSTIMSYAGICGNDDLQSHSDSYFHFASHQEIYTYVASGFGSSCAAESATGNTPPTVDAGENYVIPKDTPFTLTATGDDGDEDSLVYTWEERDLGPQRDILAPDNGSSPLFRSWSPTSDPNRTFPRLTDLLDNTTVTGEQLPTQGRAMLFRCTVRDTRAGGGGVASDDITVTVDDNSGPFRVTFPNTALTLSGMQNVTWDPAGTAASPVNAATVNILLSTNGGLAFPVTLASNVPNDGVQAVVLPELVTSSARIKVEGHGSIFFDVSDADFSTEGADVMTVVPIDDAYASGLQGGPFAPPCGSYTVSNAGPSAVVWTASVNVVWLNVSPAGGSLQPGEMQIADVCVGSRADTLAVGDYTGTATIRNIASGAVQTRRVYLDVIPPGGRIQFSAPTFNVQEGTAAATVTVTRVDDATGDVGVSYATSNGTAVAGEDYVAAAATLSWTNGDLSAKTFTVSLNDDADFETVESVRLFLHAPTGGATVATPGEADLLIEDDDDNDHCDDALIVDAIPFSMSRDTSDASSAGDPQVSCVTNFGNGVWYLFVPPSNGLMTVSTAGSDYDTAIGVYTGSCESLTAMGCDDDGGPDLTSRLIVGVAQARPYYVLVGGYEGRVGWLTVSIDFETTITPEGCTNVLRDSSFEAGDPWPDWTIQTSDEFGTPLCDREICDSGETWGPRQGDNWAYFGSPGDVAETATAGQLITLPAGTTVTLQFSLWIGFVTSPYTDELRVTVDGNTVWSVLEPETAEADYTTRVVGLDAFADDVPHTLLFEYTSPTNGGFSDFNIDDIVLEVCQPDNDGDGLPDATDPDDDNDGMPDDWETRHDLDPFDECDAGEDGDQDRATNLEEYMADTIPTNSASVLKVHIGSAEGALDPELRFDTSTARTYSVVFRTNLLSGDWTGIGTNLPGTGGERTVPVTNDVSPAFFEVGASPR